MVKTQLCKLRGHQKRSLGVLIENVRESRKRHTRTVYWSLLYLVRLYYSSIYRPTLREERRGASALRPHHHAFGRGFAIISLFRAELISHTGTWETTDGTRQAGGACRSLIPDFLNQFGSHQGTFVFLTLAFAPNNDATDANAGSR